MSEEYELEIGEELDLQINQRIIYAGRPNEETFSLVITFTSSTESGATQVGYNLFFPSKSKEIRIGPITLEIESVSPEMFIFKMEE